MILNYAGIAVFSASGATVGVRKGFDLFGIATMRGYAKGVDGVNTPRQRDPAPQIPSMVA